MSEPSLTAKRAVEKWTGWLFGTYSGLRGEMTDPLFSVGFTIESCGGVECRSGIAVTFGSRGVYLCRADALERHTARQIAEVETYANTAERFRDA